LALTGFAVSGATAAELAFARSTPIGNGIVVVRTNLEYNTGEAAGTGMVLTSSGEVLTNNHVIRDATTIKVTVAGAAHTYTAKVVGYDVAADVAVLQLSDAANLKTVSTSSAALKVGQAVTATGNAGGTGSLTSASGAVTALRRAITVSDDQGGSESLSGLIETDAALQPGDSGGPLENAAGEVVGMDTAASVAEGYGRAASSDGFAIPISRALSVVKQIASGKTTATVHIGTTALLGVEVTDTVGYRTPYNSSATGSTVVIAGVASGSPAAKAGLTAGDTIVRLDGHTVSSSSSVTKVMLTLHPGQHVAVIYSDATGQQHTTTVTLGSGAPQ
jgi:S1-C subfamily serine protease